MIWWVFFTLWAYGGSQKGEVNYFHTKQDCETTRSADLMISPIVEEKGQIKLEEISECIQITTHNPLIEGLPKCDSVPKGTMPVCRP